MPFDLHGPQFLLFYLVLGACVLVPLVLMRHSGESDEPPAVNLSDPYLIAYLRGGKNETLRVATVSLIDRGFLTVNKSKLTAVRDRSRASLRLYLEQRLLDHFSSESEAASVFKSKEFDRDLQAYEQELIRLDLIPSSAAKSARRSRAFVAIAVLWGVAAIKLGLAISRGRSNIQFLVILAIVFAVVAFLISVSRHTRRGIAMLASLRDLFGSLKQRSSMFSPGANPNELLLMAAVFGVATLPASAFPYTKTLYPQASSSGSCGSSCGSSSCGGGGCGSGCGGCGS